MNRLFLISMIFSALLANTALADDIEARIDWSQRIDMSTTVSGLIAEVLVNEGDKVEKGAVLLRLQPARFEAALSSAVAAKKDTQYKLKEAEREWHRAQELYERTVLSDTDLQLAENNLVAAQAVFAKAQAQYINAQRDVAESVIRAPFAAIILQRHAQPGQTVVTRMHSVALISIAATQHYYARGVVSITVANKLVSRQAIAVTVNDKQFNGILVSVGYEPNKNSETYPVVVRFTTAGSLLRAGQAATIHLP